MAWFFPWFANNWFNIIQTVGIIGGLWFTATTVREATKAQQEATAARREETKARRVTNLIAFAERHRALWTGLFQGGSLKRVLRTDIDAKKNPATEDETERMNVILNQFEMGWEIALIDDRNRLGKLALDVCDFISRPLPSAFWEQKKQFRDERFVGFVETALANK